MIYKFVDINSLVIPRNCYSAYVDEHINSKHELFQFFNDTFHFPEWWSGWDWDALNGLCRDFSWLRDGNIYIVNKSLPRLNKEDMRIYLGALYMYSEYWENHHEHNVIVYFDKSIRDEVCALCEQYKIPLPSDDKKEK